MKNKIKSLMSVLLVSLLLTGCGEDPELTRFKDEIEQFCTNISELGTAIDSINVEEENSVENAKTELLGYLDQLDAEFQVLAAIDFPEEFDYLENLADEASEYMTTAAASYHDAYSNNSYNEYTAEYAHENYSRAYKRVQVIITCLHGEDPTDVDLNIEYKDPELPEE